MVTKSKLKMALAAEKGVDFKKLALKKKEKVARKGKAGKSGGEKKSNEKPAEDEWEDFEEEIEQEVVELSEGESGSGEEVEEPMQVCSPTQRS
jgi:rRNA-processing protein EBP2